MAKADKRRHNVPLNLTIDQVTDRLLDNLAQYGCFGTTREEAALFVLRCFLWEEWPRLKERARDDTLGGTR